jgi:hypothetical protein
MGTILHALYTLALALEKAPSPYITQAGCTLSQFEQISAAVGNSDPEFHAHD